MFKPSIPALALAALVFASASSRAQSMPPPQWVGTWAASPIQADSINIRLFPSFTMREVVHNSAGGPQIRLRFTNEFGLDLLAQAFRHVSLFNALVLAQFKSPVFITHVVIMPLFVVLGIVAAKRFRMSTIHHAI